MDADVIHSLARATHDGSLPFPQIIGELLAQDVEYYHVDFVRCSFTFYSAAGSVVTAPLSFDGLPSTAAKWDANALKAAILDSQQHGQKFRQFCERAVLAGVQGYFVFLRGQRVIYFGRGGDQHVEWFPGAKPSDT